MRLSEIRLLLDSAGIRLTKSLGQNFLHDRNQLERIVDAAELAPSDPVLEIGPGLGPLTELLLPKARQVLAIEKDQRLVALLRQRFPDQPNLQIVHADAVAYLGVSCSDWSGWKVVSNLPYSVASTILVELARNQQGPGRITTTLQWEVARRLLAAPRDPDYGPLTLYVLISYQPQSSFKIPATCFFPTPTVDSACVTLLRRAQPLLSPPELASFNRIVKQAFSQRRKMMIKLLKQSWPEPRLARAFDQLGLNPAVRAEELSLTQFVQLTRHLHPAPPP